MWRRSNSGALFRAISASALVTLCMLFSASAASATGSVWNTPFQLSGSPNLVSVSCAPGTTSSSGLCMAVSSATAYSATNPAGGSGSYASSTPANSGSLSTACISTSFCFDSTTGGHWGIASFSGNTATWTDNPAGATQFKATSCPSSNFCIHTQATSSTNVLFSSTPTVASGGWGSAVTLPSGGTLNSIACSPGTTSTSGSGVCVAGSSNGDIDTTTNPAGTASAWTSTNIDTSTNTITGVFCQTSSFCVAVDNNGNAFVSTNPTGGAGAWTKTDIDGTTALTSVSCGSTSACVAVDGLGNAFIYGTSWGTATSIDSSRAITSVTCTSTSFCEAVDSSGFVITGSLSTDLVNTVAPTVSGTVGIGNTLTANHGTWTGSGTITYTYQWQRCNASGLSCVAISGATGSTYVVQSADGNNTLNFIVTASDPTGSASATSAVTTVVPAAPVNTVLPSISGNQVQGSTLTVSNGTWTGTPSPTFTYQWYRGTSSTCTAGNTAISGATSSTYVLQAADAGDKICAVVSASNSQGSASATATATGDIAGPVVNTITLTNPGSNVPYLAGTTIYYNGSSGGSFRIQDAISGGSGTASSTTFGTLGGTTTGWSFSNSTVSSPAGGPFKSNSVSWSSGASSSPTEAVTGTDSLGDQTTTNLTFTNDTTTPTGGAVTVNGVAATSGGSSSSSTATSFSISSRTDYTDSGSGLASSVLTIQSASENASTGACGSAGSAGPYTTQTTITGTTQPSITDGFCYIYLLTGTDNVGNTTSVSTTVAVLSTPAANAAPTVSDTTSANYSDGDSLSTTNGTFTGSVASFTYQWQRCNSSGLSCASIPGATSSAYAAQDADVGSTLRAVVTATNASGSAINTSAATQVITASPVANTSAPVLTGQPIVGQSLNVTNGVWSGAPAPTYTYQWKDCANGGDSCASISGATSSTYTVQSSDLNSTLEAVITATNANGSVSTASNLTAEVNSSPSTGYVYGNGADGAITLDTSGGVSESSGTDFVCAKVFISCAPSSTYTLIRDVNATNITLNSGVTLNTNGYIIYATGTATVSSGAVVENNGASAVGFNQTSCTPSNTCTQAAATGLSSGSLEVAVAAEMAVVAQLRRACVAQATAAPWLGSRLLGSTQLLEAPEAPEALAMA